MHGAQARVADTLAALDRLADVEQSADVVAAAVAGADYETAVAHVAKLRAAGALGGGDGAAATSPGRKDLRSVHAELSAQVRAELERAVAAADGAAVVRFAALLPPLGLSDAAAAAFTTWCDAQLASAAADGAAGASAQRLGAVLQRAGALCASAATVFEGKGGGGGAEGRAARVQLVLSIRDKRSSSQRTHLGVHCGVAPRRAHGGGGGGAAGGDDRRRRRGGGGDGGGGRACRPRVRQCGGRARRGPPRRCALRSLHP